MSQLRTTDFASGPYKIAQDNFSSASLTAYITKYEKQYLQELMGVAMYDAYIAEVGSGTAPSSAEMLAIHNPFAEDNPNTLSFFNTEDVVQHFGKIIRSNGILEMLKGFIYFHFVGDQHIKTSISGPVEEENENSKKLGNTKAAIKEKYNEAVNTHNAIIWKIKSNSQSYPLFNGEAKEIIIY